MTGKFAIQKFDFGPSMIGKRVKHQEFSRQTFSCQIGFCCSKSPRVFNMSQHECEVGRGDSTDATGLIETGGADFG